MRRLAIVLRIELAGVSSKDAAVAAPDAAGAAPEGLYFSISCFVILPPGPVPLRPFNGTPRSKARTLAAGLAFGSRSRLVCNLSPVDSDSCGSGAGSEGFEAPLSSVEGEVSDPDLGGSDDSAASSLGAGAGAFSPPASSSVNDSKAETSVPSSTITAIGYFYKQGLIKMARALTFPTATSFSPDSFNTLAKTASS